MTISDEAVEAAAIVHCNRGESYWPDWTDEAKAEAMQDMRAALEAAAPNMLAGALVPVAFKARARDMPSTCKWTSGCPQVNGHDGECTAQP